MYTIAKEYSFAAAHHLPHVPEDHPCRAMHGHTWAVTIKLSGDMLDHQGFLVDFRLLEPMSNYIKEQFDHALLNDVIDNPTCENLARHLWKRTRHVWPGLLVTVRVAESPTSWAEYERGSE